MRNFRRYDVWIDAIELVAKTYSITEAFPPSERFNLSNQMRRSAISIPSNIAEGASRKSRMEFSRFVEISLGSTFELETQFIIAAKQCYISADALESILTSLHSIQRRLSGLRNTLEKPT